MSPETHRKLVNRLRALLERDETELGEEGEIPVNEFTDPGRAERENHSLFRVRPLVIGHASSLSPGQVLPVDIGGVPVLATRDRDGTFRAFLNACRHRGMRLAEAHTSCRLLVCPYHGWTYGLAGQLASQPFFEHFPSLDRSLNGLVPLPATEVGDLLWVGLKPGSPWLDLGDVEHWVPEFGPWLAGLHVFREARQAHACNWKLVMGSLIEGHRTRNPAYCTAAKRGLAKMTRISDVEGSTMRVVSLQIGTDEARVLPLDEWSLRKHTQVSWLLFPNTMLLFHSDCVSLLQAWPEGPARCVWHHQLLTPAHVVDPRVLAGFTARWEYLERVFQGEDIVFCERSQSTFGSGANRTIKLNQIEHLVGRFHTEISLHLVHQEPEKRRRGSR